MKIITVRHGESEANDLGVTAGWMDVELNEKGLEQAKKVSDRLKDEEIDVIYSSDLKRASRTAEEIVKHHDCELILDKRVREQKKGKYEGVSGKRLWADFLASGEDILEWIPEGGESMGSVKKRVLNFLCEIEKKHKDKIVLVVSHGGTLAVVSRYFFDDVEFDGVPNEETAKRHLHKNTSVSEYSFDGDKWNVDTINCTEHLE